MHPRDKIASNAGLNESAFRCVEHFTQFCSQRRWIERLLQIMTLVVIHSMVDNGVVRITGNIKNLDFRSPEDQFVRQFPSAHAWHHDIGYEQVNCAPLLLEDGDCLGAAAGFQYGIADSLKQMPSQCS